MINKDTSKEKILKLVHPCRCKKCEHPCLYGSGALADEDLERIAEWLGMTEEEAKEKYFEEVTRFGKTRLRPKLAGKPFGKCVFYDNGCTIHPVKPLECKLAMGCKPYGEEIIKWFDFNYFLDEDDPESIRQFKIYLDSGGKTIPGVSLDMIDEEKLKKALEYDDLRWKE